MKQIIMFCHTRKDKVTSDSWLIQLAEKTYEWQTPLLLTKENVPIEAFQVEDALFIKVLRYLYKINLNNGNQEYQFDYRWGQVIR